MNPPRRSTQHTHPGYKWVGSRASSWGYQRREQPKPFAHLSGRQRAKARKGARRAEKLDSHPDAVSPLLLGPMGHRLRLKIRRMLVEYGPNGAELRKQGL